MNLTFPYSETNVSGNKDRFAELVVSLPSANLANVEKDRQSNGQTISS